eukprot:4429940-Alexandrium_andersonii.AAC.1
MAQRQTGIDVELQAIEDFDCKEGVDVSPWSSHQQKTACRCDGPTLRTFQPSQGADLSGKQASKSALTTHVRPSLPLHAPFAFLVVLAVGLQRG